MQRRDASPVERARITTSPSSRTTSQVAHAQHRFDLHERVELGVNPGVGTESESQAVGSL